MDIIRPPSRQPTPPDAKKVFSGIVFDVYQYEQKGFDGKTMTFEKLRRPDSAVTIPVTPEGKIIVSEETQPGKVPFFGIPGGRVDEGEDPLTAAKRELLEETGYKSDSWSLFDAIQPYSKIDWCVFTFVAKGCVRVSKPHADAGEKIILKELSFDEFIDFVCDKRFNDIELKLTILEAKLDTAKMAAFKLSLLS